MTVKLVTHLIFHDKHRNCQLFSSQDTKLLICSLTFSPIGLFIAASLLKTVLVVKVRFITHTLISDVEQRFVLKLLGQKLYFASRRIIEIERRNYESVDNGRPSQTTSKNLLKVEFIHWKVKQQIKNIVYSSVGDLRCYQGQPHSLLPRQEKNIVFSSYKIKCPFE